MNKKFAIALGAFVLAAVAFSAHAAMGLSPYTRVMKMGVRGNDVKMLQWALNEVDDAGLPQTGYFWTKTKAAVSNFQASSGVKADGVVGPVTYAKIQDALTAPADTTDNSTDNTTDNSTDNTTDNTSDDNSSTDNTPDTTNDNTSNNTSAATCSGSDVGDLDNIKRTTSDTKDKALEGAEDIKVLGVQMEANDACQKITSIKVQIQENGTGDTNIDKYLDEVSLWYNGVELGRKSAKDWSTDTSNVYTYRFNGLSAVVQEGSSKKGTIYVAVTADSSVDSGNENQSINVTVEEIRAYSPNGEYDTYSGSDFDTNPMVDAFEVESLSGSGDVKFKVVEHSSNPENQVVEVDDTSDTDDVQLLKFTVKAEGTDMEIKDLPINLETLGATITEIASELKLKSDGADDDVSESEVLSSSTNTSVIVFEDLDLKISKGDTVTFTVYADINDTDGNFTDGDQIRASVDGSTDVLDVEDSEGDDISSSRKSGAVTGDYQALYSQGIRVSLVGQSRSVVAGTGAADDTAELKIKFKVSAFETDVYLPAFASDSGTGVLYHAEKSGTGSWTTGVSATFDKESGTASLTGTTSNVYKISEGDNATFTLTVGVTPASAGQYRALLDGIKWGTAVGAFGQYSYTFDLEDYKTDYAVLN